MIGETNMICMNTHVNMGSRYLWTWHGLNLTDMRVTSDMNARTHTHTLKVRHYMQQTAQCCLESIFAASSKTFAALDFSETEMPISKHFIQVDLFNEHIQYRFIEQ